jgi:hypothetical protein
MSSRLAAVLLASCIVLASCAPSLKEGQNWLDKKTEASNLDVNGQWVCPEFSMVQFKQIGRDITGAFYGGGLVKGAVSGKFLYLLIYEDDKIFYTAKLEAIDKDNFSGTYIDARQLQKDWEQEATRRIRLIRPTN